MSPRASLIFGRMTEFRRSRRGRAWLFGALLALIVGALPISGFDVGLLTVLPGLLLAAIFFAWPHPGLGLIMRIAASRRRARRRIVPTTSRPAARIARGGRLIAASLGGRAPPSLLLGGL